MVLKYIVLQNILCKPKKLCSPVTEGACINYTGMGKHSQIRENFFTISVRNPGSPVKPWQCILCCYISAGIKRLAFSIRPSNPTDPKPSRRTCKIPAGLHSNPWILLPHTAHAHPGQERRSSQSTCKDISSYIRCHFNLAGSLPFNIWQSIYDFLHKEKNFIYSITT